MIDLPKNKKIILFDGICNLCNSAVAIVIKQDKKNTFLFAAIQSKKGKEIVDYLEIDIVKIDGKARGIITYEVKSTAAIKIMNDFGQFWQLTKLLWVFPKGFRNQVYDFIAKNRYKWFGKKEACMIPTNDLKEKFLD